VDDELHLSSTAVRAPVAGGDPATGRRERKLSSTLHGRKTTRGGSGSAHRGHSRDGGDGGQLRTAGRRLRTGRTHGWTAAVVTALSRWARRRRQRGVSSDTAGRDGLLTHPARSDIATRQPIRARRGATLPLTAGPHSSIVFRIKNYPIRK
jgi:hypothetical protein